MRILKLIFLFSVVPSLIHAECSFKSGDYIEELSNPKHIKNIEIIVPKSSNYVKNFFKNYYSSNPEYSTKVEDKIQSLNCNRLFLWVLYFYSGTIKQNGDWKDHIDFNDNGAPVRSLNVTS